MSDSVQADAFLWRLFSQLRKHLALDLRDYHDLRQAVEAGFGWASLAELRDVSSSLWAKSLSEQQLVEAIFDQLVPNTWNWNLESEAAPGRAPRDGGSKPKEQIDTLPSAAGKSTPAPLGEVVVRPEGGTPEIIMSEAQVASRPFIFQPQYPLTYRQVAQAWRRLRQPVREGHRVELDVDTTIAQRLSSGVATPPVLVPRRRHTARVLLLVDRQGSMTPFHRFVEDVISAMMKASRLESLHVYYFRNLPTTGADDTILAPLRDQFFPILDSVLTKIPAMSTGLLFKDRDLLHPEDLLDVLKAHATGASIMLISDGGAARRRYVVTRLLDTVAFMKALNRYTRRYVWLNPLPQRYWENTTAEQIARHVPMFPLDREGLYEAVNILRGRTYSVEAPI